MSPSQSVMTTLTRPLDYVTKLTVEQMRELMRGAPAHAEIRFTVHQADLRDQRETTSYSVKVTWKEPTS